ncbi:SDR family oxidoreductase [uncultured Ferrovibrio sp.]|jgi:NAD(P)-dependent dehydrogenase (short-subunit alcohol dehydrogenase family)|uniref:SDR family oxidoreductase n=1 Tax=uncultured Ferrovibrio sp. TaxID=1576913 RepID=UPI0026238DFA|nr:SDR family oxidoreductase [uncultured Ferrovibrio sp.]
MNNDKKQSQVVMITGAASGIGAATAKLAVAAGYRVVIADIDLDKAQATAKLLGPHTWPVKLDITLESDWEAALDRVWEVEGRLDVLINNAAIVHTGWARDLPLSAHRQTMETNCMGAINGMMTALPRLKAQGSGHLVTVASMVAFIPYPGLASYAAAKHALRAFHVALAIEERDSPVDFSLIYPGATETPMLEKEAKDDALALAFAGKPMMPEDVAAAILEALRTRPDEVYLPPERGPVVRKMGTDIEALREHVRVNTEVGWKNLQERRQKMVQG